MQNPFTIGPEKQNLIYWSIIKENKFFPNKIRLSQNHHNKLKSTHYYSERYKLINQQV